MPNLMTRIRESSLTTADPYYIPKYCGYCPQYKYRVGKTYGKTTHDILTDNNVSGSGRMVLADIDLKPRPHTDLFNEPGAEDKVRRIERRMNSYGDRKLHTRMVPGYTGYIPRAQHVVGKRYGQLCVNAISDFIEQQDKREAYQAALERDSSGNNAPVRGSYTADDMKLYISKDRPRFPVTPYKMDNDDPDKHFISGYTGFCPRSRSLIGMGYPDTTHTALNTFTDDMKKRDTIQTAPPTLHRPQENTRPDPVLYHKNLGMLPHYTGHIPGGKYSFGETYGASTTGALEKRALRPAWF